MCQRPEVELRNAKATRMLTCLHFLTLSGIAACDTPNSPRRACHEAAPAPLTLDK